MSPRRFQKGFTLIELIIVIAIIGLMATIAMPEFQKFLNRAESVTCTNNLRQIGVGVLAYVGENDNTFPVIEPNPQDPVYDPEVEATPITELEEYGVTKEVLKCPADIKGKGTEVYYTSRGTSYQWRVILDDENAASPKIYGGRRGGFRVVKPSRVSLCTDFEPIHNGRSNRVYADGHVSKPF